MPVKGSKVAPHIRFANLIEIDPITLCHVWQGSRSSQAAYPTFTDANGQIVYAYRAIWEMVYGAIPPGYHIHHACDRTDHLCCNVAHLECLSPEEHRERHRQEREAKYNSRLPWIASLVRSGWSTERIKAGLEVPAYVIAEVRRAVRLHDSNTSPATA